ncbi:hypothetical protein BDY24DRAFT_403657 [Mrakia frigida]|uniref:RPEL repeat-containing protein n=1 Tax=Mrakia frigida TaxID=29902 RepID=UPI003FCC2318
MTSTLASAAETAKEALNSVLTTAINTDEAADPLDPVTGASSKHVKSPTEEKLEGFFGSRPDKKELQEKGILKDDKVSPAIQAQREALKRAQLENTLDAKIKERPKPEELIKEGILSKDEDPTSPI